jgi:L-fuconolactonase
MTPQPTRRQALAAGAALLAGGARAADPPPVVDAHTHFYDPTRKDGVPWPAKTDAVLYRTVLPAEYKKLAAPLGVTGTVVVEASPRVEDNQWLLDLAKDEPFLAGVVGRLLPDDKDFAGHLARFAKNPRFRGVRVNEAELRAALTDAPQADRLKALGDNGLTLDVNGGAGAFPLAAQAAEKWPKLRVVVNQMGNPAADGKEPPEAWRKAVAAGGAAGPSVWCKLSGLVEGTRKRDGTAPADPAVYAPVLDRVWAAFGADRLVFGSNWPVSAAFAKYETVYGLAEKYVKEKGDGAFAKVFGANAVAAYGLKPK